MTFEGSFLSRGDILYVYITSKPHAFDAFFSCRSVSKSVSKRVEVPKKRVEACRKRVEVDQKVSKVHLKTKKLCREAIKKKIDIVKKH